MQGAGLEPGVITLVFLAVGCLIAIFWLFAILIKTWRKTFMPAIAGLTLALLGMLAFLRPIQNLATGDYEGLGLMFLGAFFVVLGGTGTAIALYHRSQSKLY
ncbi:hypothetical protein SAMN02745824_0797 [Parasphingorhabdus marina DSM 22363]|uniref:Uncharacterized protein n=1 Tax=Parasphingorhabdus marina DSM 22363 TaxID=1123272 RepID=A0A1N6CR43_9SPHN|nr:hypothetical protein SAMN02745824_0797 [Parasphingorhabdus marina DSM 22363]